MFPLGFVVLSWHMKVSYKHTAKMVDYQTEGLGSLVDSAQVGDFDPYLYG